MAFLMSKFVHLSKGFFTALCFTHLIVFAKTSITVTVADAKCSGFEQTPNPNNFVLRVRMIPHIMQLVEMS